MTTRIRWILGGIATLPGRLRDVLSGPRLPPRAASSCRKYSSALLVLAGYSLTSPVALALEQETARAIEVECTLDLTSAGKMSDIVSNALARGLDQEPSRVRAFLEGAHQTYPDGRALLEAAAKHFEIDQVVLESEVERYRHCNCRHPGGEMSHLGPDGEPLELSKFATDVTLHVGLHELGHALVREFDLPVLGNEETLADAFATHYLTTYLPERAVEVLSARTRSLMIEAAEVPREQWSVTGEHDSDARRASEIAALAVAADPERYRSVAIGVGLPEDDIRSATDYGTEIHRSWRRTLAPLWMPEGVASNEARLVYDGAGAFATDLSSSPVPEILLGALRRFDWHSQVTLRFVDGDGGAGWNRSARTITIHSNYVHRFVRQGRLEAATQKR